MVEKLKTCPFCDSDAYAKVSPYQFPPDHEGGAWTWGYNVVCDASGFEGSEKGCGSSSAWAETRAEAVEAWNRRSTLSDAVAERVAEPVASVAEVRADGQRLYNTVYPSDALDKFPIGTPLYTSPPTSELEALRKRVAEIDAHRRKVLAENERLMNALIERDRRVAELEGERDVATATMVRNHQRAEAAEARVAELEKAEDQAVTDHRKIDGTIRGLERIKSDFRMRGSNATTIERAIQALRAARRVREGGKVDA